MSSDGGLLALDLGTAHSAFAAWLPGKQQPVWGKTSFSRAAAVRHNQDGAVMHALREWLGVLIDRYWPIAYMGAELPWVPQARAIRVGLGAISAARNALPMNAQTVRRLSGLYMHASEIAVARGIEWRPADTWEVERHFLGKSGHRSAEKKRLTKELCEVQGLRPVTLDEADALALLSWMQAHVLPPAQHRHGPLFEAARVVRSF